jgi:hypothetical protein
MVCRSTCYLNIAGLLDILELSVPSGSKSSIANLCIFPKDGAQLCVFTDSSKFAWSACVTAVDKRNPDLPANRQAHKPIAFYRGAWKGAELNWHIQRKECAAIYFVCKKMKWLLAVCGTAPLGTVKN